MIFEHYRLYIGKIVISLAITYTAPIRWLLLHSTAIDLIIKELW